MEELCRSLDITNLSAEDLEDVRVILKMKVYAIVSISGDPFIDPNRWYSTAVDYRGRTSPRWSNTLFHFTLHDHSLLSDRLLLMFRFYCQRTFHHHRYVGGVCVPVRRLFNLVGALGSFHQASFPVQIPAGGEKGLLSLSFQFGKSLPRLINPAPPWPPNGLPLPRSNTVGAHENPPKLHSSYPPNPPYDYIYSRQESCNYDHHQAQCPPFSFRSCSLPSAPTLELIHSDASTGSFPSSSSQHYPDSDKDDSYYSSGSYDDDAAADVDDDDDDDDL